MPDAKATIEAAAVPHLAVNGHSSLSCKQAAAPLLALSRCPADYRCAMQRSAPQRVMVAAGMPLCIILREPIFDNAGIYTNLASDDGVPLALPQRVAILRQPPGNAALQ